MKTDHFEDLIRDSKQEFAPDHPTPDVWNKIKKRKPEARVVSINWQKVMTRAASVAVIFVASYFFHDFMSERQSNQMASSNEPLFQELLEADQYYTAEIKFKKQELFKLTEGSPSLQSDINSELDDLDAILFELKEDLMDNAANQEVVEAMMQNYRLKLEILEDMLIQIKAKSNKTDDETGFSI